MNMFLSLGFTLLYRKLRILRITVSRTTREGKSGGLIASSLENSPARIKIFICSQGIADAYRVPPRPPLIKLVTPYYHRI